MLNRKISFNWSEGISRRWTLAAVLMVAGCPVPTPIGMVPAQSTTTGDTDPSTVTQSSDSSTAVSASSSTTALPTTDPVNTDTLPPTTESDTDPPEVITSLAIRFGDIPDEETTGDTNSEVADTGGGPDDDTLLLIITNGTTTCAQPRGNSACGVWSVSILIPVEQQQAGTYDLAEFNSILGEQFEDDTSGECGGSGGTLEGMLVIDSIDAAEVVGRIENAPMVPTADPDLDFTAPRC